MANFYLIETDNPEEEIYVANGRYEDFSVYQAVFFARTSELVITLLGPTDTNTEDKTRGVPRKVASKSISRLCNSMEEAQNFLDDTLEDWSIVMDQEAQL